MILPISRRPKLVILILIAIAALIYINTPTKAAEEATSSLEITIPPDRLEKIKQLKERLATKVAQLREKEQQPTYVGGEVKKIAKSSLIVLMGQDEYEVKISEDTKINWQNKAKKEADLADISVGQLLLAAGKKDDSVFEANLLILRPKYHFLIGKISSIDRQKNQFILATKGGSATIDVEKFTHTSRYNSDKERIERSGFSKLAVGDTVHVFAEESEEANLFTGLRVLILPLEDIFLTSLTPTPEATPTATKTPRE